MLERLDLLPRWSVGARSSLWSRSQRRVGGVLASGAGRYHRRSRTHPLLGLVLIFSPALLIQGAEEVTNFAPGTLLAEPCVSRPGEGPEMVLIKSGRFRMGSPAGEEGRKSGRRGQALCAGPS